MGLTNSGAPFPYGHHDTFASPSVRSQGLFSQHGGISPPVPSFDLSDTQSYEDLQSGRHSHQSPDDNVQFYLHSNSSYNPSVGERSLWELDLEHRRQTNPKFNGSQQGTDVMFTGGIEGAGSADIPSEYSVMNVTEFDEHPYQNLQISLGQPESDFTARNSPHPSLAPSPEPDNQYQDQTYAINVGRNRSQNVTAQQVYCDICGKPVTEKGFT
jgi:hypothetical protein